MDPEQCSLLSEQGSKAWNNWRAKHPDITPDLSEVRFRGLDLRGADLSKANLRKAYLKEANLSGANLESADLRDANLEKTDFSHANLRNADLRGAVTYETKFDNADLTGALGVITRNSDPLTSIQLFTTRSGSVEEIRTFLHDLESCYNNLYLFFAVMDYFDPNKTSLRERRAFSEYEFGLPFTLLLFLSDELLSTSVLPNDRLRVRRVQVASPGFWEFVGSLNPLQQIREFLNDRHKRRQDREYRERSEAERLELENKLIENQILEKENSILRERIAILKELGYSEKEIRRLISRNVSRPLVVLAQHQDTGLIERADQ